MSHLSAQTEIDSFFKHALLLKKNTSTTSELLWINKYIIYSDTFLSIFISTTYIITFYIYLSSKFHFVFKGYVLLH
jgi:hypothetical protein